MLGFVLEGHPGRPRKIVDGTLGQFPILSDTLRLHSLKGSGLALAIGVVGSLLAGMGVTSAAQNAFNRIWDVPSQEPPQLPLRTAARSRRCSSCSAR